jgi:hypothetical protein
MSTISPGRNRSREDPRRLGPVLVAPGGLDEDLLRVADDVLRRPGVAVVAQRDRIDARLAVAAQEARGRPVAHHLVADAADEEHQVALLRGGDDLVPVEDPQLAGRVDEDVAGVEVGVARDERKVAKRRLAAERHGPLHDPGDHVAIPPPRGRDLASLGRLVSPRPPPGRRARTDSTSRIRNASAGSARGGRPEA